MEIGLDWKTSLTHLGLDSLCVGDTSSCRSSRNCGKKPPCLWHFLLRDWFKIIKKKMLFLVWPSFFSGCDWSYLLTYSLFSYYTPWIVIWVCRSSEPPPCQVCTHSLPVGKEDCPQLVRFHVRGATTTDLTKEGVFPLNLLIKSRELCGSREGAAYILILPC